MQRLLVKTELHDLPLLKRGKVRDIYRVDGKLLIIATDRISALDFVLPTGIPYKGVVLNKVSNFWFERTAKIVKNHVLSADVRTFPESLDPHFDLLEGRSVLVDEVQPLPVECIVRGYLSGSAWKEYRERGDVQDAGLPAGLQISSKLAKPIFTPSTKGELGEHDVPVSQQWMEETLGKELASAVKTVSLELYQFAADIAFKRGIIVADTKFEFGLRNGELILIDELFTPDSSRFWRVEDYAPGRAQDGLDKQLVRDWLSSVQWHKTPPPIPDQIVAETQRRYLDILEKLTGERIV
ncbi:phosphoribosylaminoimidazole-succinocarboxamide synthase [candidate division TA06 bacterium DG_26]|uniref:Phosphoribosylaminoimidazole-succinocarboxamide synthase n=1 Tax=candidate division TA06 bacterium DG_26 TaxID=1703771 RepID=A0A0S7WHC9_UNCT6|nr:MAG: phosphoribosylaminoimidazole-succinocarboxamide synthase [candidate division TA06 bacterium DG_26]